jgi:hypothetical protein
MPSAVRESAGARGFRVTSERLASPSILGTALALPLAVYTSIGAFSRYTADDFCWAGTLRVEGFLNAQVFYYTVYSPRYAFTFVVTLVELAGPAIVPALPAAAILVWLAVLTWTFGQFGVAKVRGLLLAEVAAFATLQTAPDLSQSLYWQTGMLTYLLPLVLATFLVGWIRRARSAWWAVGLSGVVTFVAGGLSETYLIPQNVALTLALVAAITLARLRRNHVAAARVGVTGREAPRAPAAVPRMPQGRRVIAHLSAALAGGVLALAVIVVAPATANRVGGTPADLWLAMSAAIATAAFQALRLVRYFAPTIALCLAVPPLIGSCAPRVDRRWFVIATAIVAITLPFCYFPSFYAQNGNPPARSLIVPGAILIGYLLFAGFALRPAVEGVPEPRRALAALALGVVPLAATVSSVPQVASAARYAALFDAEDRQIRASRDAGQSDLTVPPLPPNFGEDFVTADRQNWFNTCVARYYGVRSIATPS